jgi:hypothetical protein
VGILLEVQFIALSAALDANDSELSVVVETARKDSPLSTWIISQRPFLLSHNTWDTCSRWTAASIFYFGLARTCSFVFVFRTNKNGSDACVGRSLLFERK